MVVAMNVTEDLDRWLEIVLQQNRLRDKDLLHFRD